MKFEISRRCMILFMSCVLFIFSLFYRTSIAVITPNLISDLELDTRGLSVITASFFYAFAIAQIPISMYLDSIGPRITMTLLSFIGVAGALVFAIGNSYGTLVVGRILLGIGTACNLMGAFKLITLWFGPLRFATLSAIILSVGTLGSIMSTTPLVLLVQLMGWRNTFLAFAGVNFTLTIIFFVVVRDRPKNADHGNFTQTVSTDFHEILSNIRDLFTEKDYWIISLGTFCRYGIIAAVQGLWAGPYLMSVIGISPVAAGNILFLISIGMLVGSPVVGWLSDSVLNNRKGVIITGLSAMILILVILAFLPRGVSHPVLSILFFSLGFFNCCGQVMYAHIKERMPVERAGTAMTGVNFFTMAGVAVFLQGLGSLMQYLYPGNSLGAPAFRMAFIFCAACLALSMILYHFTIETRGRH